MMDGSGRFPGRGHLLGDNDRQAPGGGGETPPTVGKRARTEGLPGPVAFLSGGGMLYAGWGAPGGLWYMRRAGSTLSYELHGPVGPAVPVAIPESP